MSQSDGIFYANTCAWCNTANKTSKLKQCCSCKMVSFCSKEHEKKYSKQHKSICNIFQQVQKMNLDKLSPNVDFKNKKEWFNFRTKFMLITEMMNKNKLTQSEVNMILFPQSCEVCHSTENLTVCSKCVCVNYCSPDHEAVDRDFHNRICSSLRLCFDIDLYLVKNVHFYQDIDWQNNLQLTQNMETFLNTNMILQNKVQTALAAELLTCPLTGAYILQNISAKTNITLHVIGASMLETVDTQFWEVILHLTHVQMLNVCFIGPEINVPDDWESKLCQTCLQQGKQMNISFNNVYYHEFCGLQEFPTPDVIIMFNCGLHEYEGSDMDTWKDSLVHLAKQKCDIALTSFTKDEAEKDIRRLLEFGRLSSNLKWNGVNNPFSSLRPFRDLENLGVYYNNSYISLLGYSS